MGAWTIAERFVRAKRMAPGARRLVLAPPSALRDSDRRDGAEFIRRLRRLARKRRLAFDMDTRRGRGSPRIIYFGARRTTVKNPKEEIGKVCFARCAAISASIRQT
jgi:mRNA interferase HicA